MSATKEDPSGREQVRQWPGLLSGVLLIAHVSWLCRTWEQFGDSDLLLPLNKVPGLNQKQDAEHHYNRRWLSNN
jgi:hypothetical protein